MKWIKSERRPIQIQKPTSTQDATGGFVTEWETVRSPIALVMEKDKSTLFNQESYGNESVYSFQFRTNNFTPELETGYRILYRNFTFQIESIKRIGRGIIEVVGIQLDITPEIVSPWILAQGFWNRDGFWTREDNWIREPA